jgi:hypothetical protein
MKPGRGSKFPKNTFPRPENPKTYTNELREFFQPESPTGYDTFRPIHSTQKERKEANSMMLTETNTLTSG